MSNDEHDELIKNFSNVLYIIFFLIGGLWIRDETFCRAGDQVNPDSINLMSHFAYLEKFLNFSLISINLSMLKILL